MKLFLKSFFFAGLFVVTNIQTAFAQPIEVAISEEGTHESINCQQYLILTDSNADNGNYEENESFEATLCFTSIEGDIAQVQILPTNPATGNVWDIDGNSSLFIYEGTGTSGTLLGEFNSESDPEGVFFTTDVACLTFVFISGSSSSGEGFLAEIKCLEDHQPFDIVVAAIDPTEYSSQDFDGLNSADSVLTICYQDSISFQTILNFPLSDATGNGYEQSLESTNIIWSWGDGSTDQGLGLDVNGHVYEPFGGFLLTITAIDQMGRQEVVRINVLVAPRPIFTGLLFKDTLCIGDTTQLTGGILLQDTVGVVRNTGAINIYLDSTDSLALPDVPGGQVTTYSTGINISNFANDPVITDPGDFVEICLNMEHSYLGDLEAWLTCPNGQTAALFQGYGGAGVYPGNGFGGGGTFLGAAIDSDDLPDSMGVGFDYCFSDDLATLGTMAFELSEGNTVPASTGNAMISGTYLPEEEFLSSFLGCPVNGPWTLNVTDNLGSDNGFIYSWNIEFSSDFYIDTVYYSPTIVNAYWEENDDIVINNDTIVTVVPSFPGNNGFTFIVEDSFGCIHDTTFNVYVRPSLNINDDLACDLTHTLTPTNENDATWTVISTPSENSTVEWDFISGATANITVNEYGLYTFFIKESEEYCGYEDSATIDFRPDPKVLPLISDTTLCIGASIFLDAGPQDANSGNFDITWISSTAGVINTEDYSITVDETGIYSVIIAGHCGVAGDTTDVIAITIEFEGNTICGLQSAASANVAPQGTGFWSAAENISFTNANQTGTQISSSDFGTYPITYTDYRCIDDGVTRDVTFVEQPEVQVVPANPDFCADKQSLILSAIVSGSHNGSYTWSINGTPELGDNDSLFFPPDYFTPLEDYVIRVTVRDFYNVCQLATGDANFTGRQCEYNIPNVVTPNADGKNDKFEIEYIHLFPGTKLRVYDRWGKTVFEQADYDKYQASTGGWDPTDVNSGTYFFELLIPYAETIETGYIQVLKDGSGD
ncbi:gliding motility-associated C-terminal domain-containing protein [Cryomorpha ignava]|uniref:Gliding motility-associated C-terminal domain-containing protein n=1 Tax=Cryomorpha ignava TaxID=101383 RepID=A0A7K3WTC0_9FLAO|nr:gliding motility-associated C-terminal domain-containing protein [Cryomorpha ignava]NEN24122.1 gliding motility-associated C-terminal domain-containing protein [Cryomorpha ignava]